MGVYDKEMDRFEQTKFEEGLLEQEAVGVEAKRVRLAEIDKSAHSNIERD